MLRIRCDASVPGELAARLLPPLERAAVIWPGLADAFVYCVPDPRGPRELMIRVSTTQGVVPLMFRLEGLEAGAVETVVRGTLERGDL